MKVQMLKISAVAAALTVALVGSALAGSDVRADAIRPVEAVPVYSSFLAAEVQDANQLVDLLVAKGGDTAV